MTDELKKQGYPIYTIRVEKLKEGDRNEWSSMLWYILSKNMVHDDCLKWINKTCHVHLETYENAYNHNKKIIMSVLSKTLEPVIRNKITDYNKLVDIFVPSIPILSCIESKKQFILLLNLLFYRFSRCQVKTVSISNYNYKLHINGEKGKCHSWILGSNNFSSELSGNYYEDIYLVDKKMLSFQYSSSINVNLKFKEDCSFAVWNNQCFDPLKIYIIKLEQK